LAWSSSLEQLKWGHLLNLTIALMEPVSDGDK
jgi:hypothetical protein